MPKQTETTLRDEIEKLKNDVFYWMIRNHNGAEKSYAMLAEVKERLIEALNHDN